MVFCCWRRRLSAIFSHLPGGEEEETSLMCTVALYNVLCDFLVPFGKNRSRPFRKYSHFTAIRSTHCAPLRFNHHIIHSFLGTIGSQTASFSYRITWLWPLWAWCQCCRRPSCELALLTNYVGFKSPEPDPSLTCTVTVNCVPKVTDHMQHSVLPWQKVNIAPFTWDDCQSFCTRSSLAELELILRSVKNYNWGKA